MYFVYGRGMGREFNELLFRGVLLIGTLIYLWLFSFGVLEILLINRSGN